jgi:deoxyribodipyrimidine photo-lyase
LSAKGRIGSAGGAWRWWRMALDDLSVQLEAQGSHLIELSGEPASTLRSLVRAVQAQGVYCEAIEAPEEQAQVAQLCAAGVAVHSHWQSSLIDPQALPFAPNRVPDVFTAFRQALERAGVHETAPAPPVQDMPPAWPRQAWPADGPLPPPPAHGSAPEDSRSSFPLSAFHGGERAALRHLSDYCGLGLPYTYKATRNALSGVAASSKWSPWLATGALSARQAMAQVRALESQRGATDSTYWLWFELLWRDHFRWLHLKHGRQLYRGRGLLAQGAAPMHRPPALRRWTEGRTGHALIDAGMRELRATGWLSNRMRQVVASYLVHDLRDDWRAGAAWFESQLLDYDVYSNQGNWLYLSGRGTDPRGGRRFNPDKQAQDHDPQGHYRHRWATP